jgi:hypothetical protein
MRAFSIFLKSLVWEHGGRRWIAMSGPSALLWMAGTVAGWFGIHGTAQWWTWGLAILSGILIASYLAWHEQFTKNRDLTIGSPRLVLADPPVEIVPFALRETVEQEPTTFWYTLQPEGKPRGTALRLRICNQPVGRSETCIAQAALAKVSYYSDGKRVDERDGRWADAPQMADRDQSRDFVANDLPVRFPIGSTRSLDIVATINGRPCIAISNDSFVNGNGNLEIPGKPQLRGVVDISVQLDGVNINTTVRFSIDCDTFSVKSAPILIDNLSGLKLPLSAL